MKYERPKRSAHPIQEEMARIERDKKLAAERPFFSEHGEVADLDEEGNVVVPDKAESRFYVDPRDGQVHQREIGKRLPPHTRAA